MSKLKTINISYDPYCSGNWDKYADIARDKPGIYMNGGMEYTVEAFIEKKLYNKAIKILKKFLDHYNKRQITNGFHDLLAKETKQFLNEGGKLNETK